MLLRSPPENLFQQHRPKPDIEGTEIPQCSGGKRGIIFYCMNDPQPEGHMASQIERRKFLATLGGAAAAWPLAARAHWLDGVQYGIIDARPIATISLKECA